MNNSSKINRSGPVLFSEYEKGSSVKKALEMDRQDILFEMKDSGLKGRGGAGYPVSTKWMLTAAANAVQKFIICNADEGEPGTFKDRVLLLEYPWLVFEGMIIAGYTAGAKNGIVYLRAEYSYLQEFLEDYIDKLRKENLLGKNICGKDLEFDIKIILGAGAYVCGEETALIESLEGHRGEPRNRPPYPVNTGYLGFPTSVNNVETLASVPHIIMKGSKWYRKFGTENSSGSKLISVSGDCKYPGVYEVSWGTTLKEILELTGAENTKAMQIGGASGVCLPVSEFHRTLAYEDIATGGSVMIFNKDRSMLEVLKNFMKFFVEESCGQCTPCRIGNVRLLEGVEMIENKNYKPEYIDKLKDLGRTMQIASKCGLGQTSPNPFLSILENFKDEIFSKN
ncbi:MAG TPA: NADH-ubiquinone oxidoreductase-F iron-sulfur binding region domain-containing protein [Ignavibacteria bacterium]|nr:NADH-ubiquinone oxidoreductase-F iron-sulfur binding region domain-containing protein [Ignavibacteria bacterium]HMR39667.1 NADH-ubiquinone oxidoreductase-F iron-sulfur binding region domain-containing protein [Ignavibacteria bacterium]